MNLAARLKELRGDTPLTEIERQTGVPRGNLFRYEQGVYLPKPKVLKALAAYYKLPYKTLKCLYYEDLYSNDAEELEIVLYWARHRDKGF